MNNSNILDIQSKKEIYNWFLFLSKDLITNNNSFFHYTEQNLQKYLKHPELDLGQRFNQFCIYWNNFNNQKRLLQRYIEKTPLPSYPLIFKENKRHIIHKFVIDFNLILTEINTLKLNNKTIPYSYIILIQKLIKIIVSEKLFPNKKIIFYSVNVLDNIIEFQIKDINYTKIYSYKLNKFLQKWQSKFPDLYKTCSAYLIVSSDYRDMLLQSTFKQWTSCLNLINTYVQTKIKYTCVNNIKNGNLIAYCIFDLHDGKSVDEIMNDLTYHGLCYNRCFWRCSIKRLSNIKNLNEYIFVPQCTSYGTIMQNAISYNEKLFYHVHKFITQLNNKFDIKFNQNEYYKTFKIMFPMYSDMFTYLNKNNQYKLYYFNTQLSITSKYLREKINSLIRYNIQILTSDILALLNIFKYFNENKIDINTQKYINNIYFNKENFVLNNSFEQLNRLS